MIQNHNEESVPLYDSINIPLRRDCEYDHDLR